MNAGDGSSSSSSSDTRSPRPRPAKRLRRQTRYADDEAERDSGDDANTSDGASEEAAEDEDKYETNSWCVESSPSSGDASGSPPPLFANDDDDAEEARALAATFSRRASRGDTHLQEAAQLAAVAYASMDASTAATAPHTKPAKPTPERPVKFQPVQHTRRGRGGGAKSAYAPQRSAGTMALWLQKRASAPAQPGATSAAVTAPHTEVEVDARPSAAASTSASAWNRLFHRSAAGDAWVPAVPSAPGGGGGNPAQSRVRRRATTESADATTPHAGLASTMLLQWAAHANAAFVLHNPAWLASVLHTWSAFVTRVRVTLIIPAAAANASGASSSLYVEPADEALSAAGCPAMVLLIRGRPGMTVASPQPVATHTQVHQWTVNTRALVRDVRAVLYRGHAVLWVWQPTASEDSETLPACASDDTRVLLVCVTAARETRVPLRVVAYTRADDDGGSSSSSSSSPVFPRALAIGSQQARRVATHTVWETACVDAAATLPPASPTAVVVHMPLADLLDAIARSRASGCPFIQFACVRVDGCALVHSARGEGSSAAPALARWSMAFPDAEDLVDRPAGSTCSPEQNKPAPPGPPPLRTVDVWLAGNPLQPVTRAQATALVQPTADVKPAAWLGTLASAASRLMAHASTPAAARPVGSTPAVRPLQLVLPPAWYTTEGIHKYLTPLSSGGGKTAPTIHVQLTFDVPVSRACVAAVQLATCGCTAVLVQPPVLART